jgi:hypothetical protein
MVEGPDKEPVISADARRPLIGSGRYLCDRPPSQWRNVDRRIQSLELAVSTKSSRGRSGILLRSLDVPPTSRADHLCKLPPRSSRR